ncbi:hypothetical protein LY76DRAFT_529391 [Colletotrichum caudatum]|nr:hypothetical protein LY76DRAFT_529391 [Colletotrichum caudatum]
MKYFCVLRYCGLCRYELSVRDYIVAGKLYSTFSILFLMQLVRRDGTERSQPYHYSIKGFTDSSLGIEYVQCRGRCHHDEARVGCHLDCNNIIPPETFRKVYEATAPDFEPSAIANK